jgi:hypothetical protein
MGSVRADFSTRVLNDILVAGRPEFCPAGILEIF